MLLSVPQDPRGGHNRYKINQDFFKTWNLEMAYVLGYIYADGTLLDTRNSSRACYFAIISKDKSILLKIRRILKSNHILEMRKGKPITFGRDPRIYIPKSTYRLRVGSVVMYNDLINRGLKPRKSLDILFPNVPPEHFFDFLRGYFDGDGCLYISKPGIKKKVSLIFTSGSLDFLLGISNNISGILKVNKNKVLKSQNGAFQLTYSKNMALLILKEMYKSAVKNKLYLDRKYEKYQKLLNSK